MANLEGRTPEELTALGELANALATNPKTREGFLRLTKIANPEASIPEVDIPASLERHFKPALDELAGLRKREQDREIQERAEAGRRAALKVKGIGADDMDAVEKLMVDKQIPSHETAAQFLAAQRHMAEPTAASVHPTRIFTLPTMPDKKALEGFGGNMKAYQRSVAYQTIDELHGRRPA